MFCYPTQWIEFMCFYYNYVGVLCSGSHKAGLERPNSCGLHPTSEAGAKDFEDGTGMSSLAKEI